MEYDYKLNEKYCYEIGKPHQSCLAAITSYLIYQILMMHAGQKFHCKVLNYKALGAKVMHLHNINV